MAQITGFDASQVPQLIVDLENAWADARGNEANTASLQADTQILTDLWNSEQTASLYGPLTENDSCKPVKVEWLESANSAGPVEGTSTNHTAVTCEIDGDGPASNKIEYQITNFIKDTLKIPVKDCGNSFSFDQKFQRKFLSKQIGIANLLASKIPAFLEANAGVNLYTDLLGTYATLGGGGNDNTLVRIPAGNFNAFDIVPYLAKEAMLNRFRDPAVFDGGNMYYQMYNAKKQQGTPAGDAGQENHFQGIRAYEDAFNFLKTAGLSDRTYVMDRGAIAMYTAAYNEVRADVVGNGFAETRFRSPLLGLSFPTGNGRQAVEMDTIYRRERLPVSDSSDVCEDFFVWEMKVWYILLLNPLMSAGDGVNGILRFKKDPTLAQIGTPMQKAL